MTLAPSQPVTEPCYYPNFLSGDRQARLLRWLSGDACGQWQVEQFRIFGKAVNAPRSSLWFGDAGLNYRYTGLDHAVSGWPSELMALRNSVCDRAGCSFNFVLINRYDHGGQYMGWHRDNEHGTDRLIASVSLGAIRRFKLRRFKPSGADEPQGVHTLDLESGSLLTFDGSLEHTLCKTRQPRDCRINLTFRKLH